MENALVQECPICTSKKVDITHTINRVLYGSLYVVMIGIAAWIAIATQGSPMVYLLIGLGASFVLFVIRLMLEKRKITKCKCLDCGNNWQVQSGK